MIYRSLAAVRVTRDNGVASPAWCAAPGSKPPERGRQFLPLPVMYMRRTTSLTSFAVAVTSTQKPSDATTMPDATPLA
jgi:hypothetical protein